MNNKIEEVLDHPLTIPAVIGLIGFGSGLGVGFFLGRRKYQIYEKVEVHDLPVSVELEIDVDEKKEEVTIPRPPRVVIDEEEAVKQGIIKVDGLADLRPSMVSDEATDDVVEEETTTEVVVEEVTTETETPHIPWDWDEELGKRLSTVPYILHQEEYFANELNFTQSALTYYAGDNILVDEDNVPIYNHGNTVGDLTFGHGSGQEDVVYIRNHELKAEYEITKLDQLYSIEILGLQIEDNERVKDLKHSKNMKFRME